MNTQSRQPAGVPTGGQFAASAHAESGVALAEPVTDRTTHLGSVFADAGLPGTFDADGGDTTDYGSGTYTSADGHDYRVENMGGSVQVRAEDVDAYAFSIRADDTPPTQEQVLSLLHSCEVTATDVRSFNAAVKDWLETPQENRGYGWSEPYRDTYNGEATFGQHTHVTLNGFTSHDPDLGCPSMKVHLASESGDERPLEFTVTQGPGGPNYLRGGDTDKPLATWERRALDSEIAHRMNRSGHVASLFEVLGQSVRNAHRANRKAGRA